MISESTIFSLIFKGNRGGGGGGHSKEKGETWAWGTGKEVQFKFFLKGGNCWFAALARETFILQI